MVVKDIIESYFHENNFIMKEEVSAGRVIMVVFLDLKRVFEIVNTELWLEKLKGYGLKETVVKWFWEFWLIENRKQNATVWNHPVLTLTMEYNKDLY